MGETSAGRFVFVFGSGFQVNQTQVSVNGVTAPLVQVLSDTLVVFMVPDGASSGAVTVTTPDGSATGPTALAIH